MKLNDWTWVIARFLIGMIYAYAGFTKLVEPIENFRAVIAQYEVIPYAFISVISYVVPWLEFLGGVFLILGYQPRWSALAISVISFALLIIVASGDILGAAGGSDCGCFGSSSPLHFTVRQIFLVDCISFVLGIKLYALRVHPFSLDNVLS